MWMTLDDPTFINLEAKGTSGGWHATRAAVDLLDMPVDSRVPLRERLQLQAEVRPCRRRSRMPPLGYEWVTYELRRMEQTWLMIELVTVVCFSVEFIARGACARPASLDPQRLHMDRRHGHRAMVHRAQSG